MQASPGEEVGGAGEAVEATEHCHPSVLLWAERGGYCRATTAQRWCQRTSVLDGRRFEFTTLNFSGFTGSN